MQQRITAVEKYLVGSPGSIGVVLDDRATGAIWRNANATREYPAASTMKLAMITDLLLRNQAAAGHIHLTATDRKEMYQALYTSNDIDANDLWDKYENGSFLRRIQAFGMTRAEFTGSPPNWGYMYCTAEDLDDLINYVLSKPPASIRDYLIYRLRHVSPLDQQWGVWGAGPENQPGNKDAQGRVKKFAASMKTIKKVAQYMEVIFAEEPFSKENGMLRPNMKIDRKAISAKYGGGG